MKVKQDNGQEVEQACGKVNVIGKESLWNLKRHPIRNHDEVMRKIVYLYLKITIMKLKI